MKRKMSLIKDKKGQSLIEFALVLPILLLVLLGIMEFGRMIMAANVLNQAAREGARVGAVTSDADSTVFRETIENRVNQLLGAANITGARTEISLDPDRTLRVTIDYGFPFATKFFDLFLPDTVSLKGSCVMYYEG